MSVTLTPSLLIYPVGKLQRAWFHPATDAGIEAAIQEWLDLAAARVDTDNDARDNAAAAHYVYWRAFESIALRIAGVPESEQYGAGSSLAGRRWDGDQIAHWQALADAEQAMFEAALSGLGGGVTIFHTARGFRGR